MLHHLWLLSSGVTTSESFKWADVKDALAGGEIVILDQDDPFMCFSFVMELTVGQTEVRGSSRWIPRRMKMMWRFLLRGLGVKS
jgi:hypothetical protein